LFAFGCGEDDEADDADKENGLALIGTWVRKERLTAEPGDPWGKISFTFNKDGTLTYTEQRLDTGEIVHTIQGDYEVISDNLIKYIVEGHCLYLVYDLTIDSLTVYDTTTYDRISGSGNLVQGKWQRTWDEEPGITEATKTSTFGAHGEYEAHCKYTHAVTKEVMHEDTYRGTYSLGDGTVTITVGAHTGVYKYFIQGDSLILATSPEVFERS